jgi:hypothetical protein
MATRVDKAREIVGHPLTLEKNFIQSPLGWYLTSLFKEEFFDYVDFLQME